MLAGDFTHLRLGRSATRTATSRCARRSSTTASTRRCSARRRCASSAALPADHRPVRPRQLQPQPRRRTRAQYIGKVDFQLTQNHSHLRPLHGDDGNVYAAAGSAAGQPPGLDASGGRDNLAQSLTVGDTMVLSNTMVNYLRFAYNHTDIHRTHEPLGFFGANDVGINTYSYLDGLHAAEHHRRLQPRRRHRERGALQDHRPITLSDDLTHGPRQPPVRLRRHRAPTGRRCRRPTSARRAVHVQRRRHRARPRRLPDRPAQRRSSRRRRTRST